jgi:hypothetical protein
MRPPLHSDRNNSARVQTAGINYGEFLYQRGMRRNKEKEIMYQRARSEQDRSEVEGITFQPHINKRSKSMRRVNNEKPEEFLLRYGQAVKEKIDSQRIEKYRNETEGLDFKPKISKMSERIMTQKDAYLNSQMMGSQVYAKFDRLYEDAKRRQER